MVLAVRAFYVRITRAKMKTSALSQFGSQVAQLKNPPKRAVTFRYLGMDVQPMFDSTFRIETMLNYIIERIVVMFMKSE